MFDKKKLFKEDTDMSQSCAFTSFRPNFLVNIRFIISKKIMQELFVKWITQDDTQDLVETLISEQKSGKCETQHPDPFFYPIKPLHKLAQSMMLSPLKVAQSTPPRSPGDIDKNFKRQLTESFQSSTTSNKKSPKEKKKMEKPILGTQQTIQAISNQIPQFFFQDGKPIEEKKDEEFNQIISDVFKSEEVQSEKFLDITTKLLSLPDQFNKLIVTKIDPEKMKQNLIQKTVFLQIWDSTLKKADKKRRCFWVLKKNENDYLMHDDFKLYMQILLDNHPGLEFLKNTPEFQERYMDTVIHRIFYVLDRNDDGRITFRDFKLSNLMEVFEKVNQEEDINTVRDFFSYEHFYVLYCKFWELDEDHDFHINKDDFSKYSGHALSRKAVDKIFEQVPRKFKSKRSGFMNYEDFIWFMLAEEDKTTARSMQYWFRLVDLDNNGIITGFEMEYFFEEQHQRLDYLNQELVYFEDYLCQMVDLLHPENDIMFKMKHFKSQLDKCGIFFDLLTNLNKLVAYEQRDPFIIKNELDNSPGYSDWDRFAEQEYLRLAMEEQNGGEDERIDGVESWDSDQELSGNDDMQQNQLEQIQEEENKKDNQNAKT